MRWTRSPRAPRPLTRLLPLLLALLLDLLAAGGARAESEEGLLSVTASVEGAVVYVDGEEVGPAPLTRMLPPGHHRVRVVADGYDPFVRRVDISPGLTTRVEAELLPGGGTVEFMVEPAGARVYVDGEEVGPAPIRIRKLRPGEHQYRIEARGYEPATGSFAFAEGKNLLLRETLRSSAGLFEVRSTPPGATVYLDGFEVGVTPLEMDGVPAGRHGVRVHRDGYADVFREVDTSDGSKGEVIVLLAERGARLVVRTGRPDAQVSVDGVLVGEGRRVRVAKVERGTAEITVEAPGCSPASRTVEIPPKGSLLLRAHLREGGHSELEPSRPLYARWGFWAGASAVAAAGATGGYLYALSQQPEPAPEGDVSVEVP